MLKKIVNIERNLVWDGIFNSTFPQPLIYWSSVIICHQRSNIDNLVNKIPQVGKHGYFSYLASGYPAFKLWKPFKVIYHGRNQNIWELFLVNNQKCIAMKSLKHVCIFAFCLAVLYCSKKYTWIGVAQTTFAWHGDLVSKVTVGAL